MLFDQIIKQGRHTALIERASCFGQCSAHHPQRLDMSGEHTLYKGSSLSGVDLDARTRGV
ncbi:MAG TPA: hypothetical protein VFU01_15385 [Gemmatimonadaceae bacterium]|nr:hypothetical protein [Gemmatimonadaceae bacterium]